MKKITCPRSDACPKSDSIGFNRLADANTEEQQRLRRRGTAFVLGRLPPEKRGVSKRQAY
jgi:hypothetical protein